MILSGCIPPCDLTNIYWDTATAVSGETVSLIVEGTNCDSKNINFEIRKDNLIGTTYVANPVSTVLTGTTTTTTWTAIAPFAGDSTPSYYFIATVSDGSDTFDSRTGSKRNIRCNRSF